MLFFTPDLFEDIDFLQEPEFLQQEFFQEIMDDRKGKLIVDQVVKVFLKSGEEKWILVHIEIQGSGDPDFPERMFRYYYRIYDRFHRDIVAIALLTDDSKTFRPDTYSRSSYGTRLTINLIFTKF